MKLRDMVIMPTVDYQNTCDAIREKTGLTDPIKSGQLPAAVDAVFAAGGLGGNPGNRMHIAQIVGTDTNTISAEIPFSPDFLIILPTEPYSLVTASTFCSAHRDFKCFGRIGGGEQHTGSDKKPIFNQFNNNTVEDFVAFVDGIFTFTPPNALKSNVWRKECKYTLIAIKYVDESKSDEDLLKDYVLSLPEDGSGSVTISARRFAETGMTEDAFNAFVQANRPGWTFTIA